MDGLVNLLSWGWLLAAACALTVWVIVWVKRDPDD